MSAEPSPATRIDYWLWTVRIYKTRSQATAACRAGSVAVGGVAVKPARDVRTGTEVVVKVGLMERTLFVLGHPPSRVAARLVGLYCEERTPPAEFEKARNDRIGQLLAREKGSGRPTKRDRRTLDALFRPS